jgi:hypothetical protein
MMGDVAFTAEIGLLLTTVCHRSAFFAFATNCVEWVILFITIESKHNFVLYDILWTVFEDIIMPISIGLLFIYNYITWIVVFRYTINKIGFWLGNTVAIANYDATEQHWVAFIEWITLSINSEMTCLKQ